MNQEQNNLNPNNFNTQGNNGIPNNQPLNNQSFNQGMSFNQQPINPQPQPTPSFQQPINQMNIEQQTPQPMNNTFESGNASNQSFNSKPPKKMNLGLIIGIVAVVAVVGVGIVFGSKLLSNGGNNSTLNDEENINNNNSQIVDDNQQNNNEPNKYTGKLLQIPTKEIYFTYPDDYNVEEETKTLIIRKNEEVLVGIFYDWLTPFDGNLEGIISDNSTRFLRDISSYSKGYLRTSTIEIKNSSSTSTAGYNSLNFRGVTSNQGKWDCHVYGYTFVVDNVKIMVIGLVSTQAQDAEMISQVNELTDKIAASVHTKK